MAEIAKQAVSTERVLGDILADCDFTETITTTVDSRVQSKTDLKLIADSVQNAVEYKISREQLFERITNALMDNLVTVIKAFQMVIHWRACSKLSYKL